MLRYLFVIAQKCSGKCVRDNSENPAAQQGLQRIARPGLGFALERTRRKKNPAEAGLNLFSYESEAASALFQNDLAGFGFEFQKCASCLVFENIQCFRFQWKCRLA